MNRWEIERHLELALAQAHHEQEQARIERLADAWTEHVASRGSRFDDRWQFYSTRNKHDAAHDDDDEYRR